MRIDGIDEGIGRVAEEGSNRVLELNDRLADRDRRRV